MKPSHQEVSGITSASSAGIAGAGRRPLPPAVAARAKLHLVDTVAAMISGSRLLPGNLGIAYVKSLGGISEGGMPAHNGTAAAFAVMLQDGTVTFKSALDFRRMRGARGYSPCASA